MTSTRELDRRRMDRQLAFNRMNTDGNIFNENVRVLLRSFINKTPDEISKIVNEYYGELIKRARETHIKDMDNKRRYLSNTEFKDDITRNAELFNTIRGQRSRFDMEELNERIRNLGNKVNEEDINIGRLNRDVGEFRREMRRAIGDYGTSVFQMSPGQVIRLMKDIKKRYDDLELFIGEYEDESNRDTYNQGDYFYSQEGYRTEPDEFE